MVVVLTTVLAACGGGDGDEGANGTREPQRTAPTAARVTVDLDDFSIEPRDLVVKRGATIVAENVGAVTHNFTVERGPDAQEDTEDVAATSTFGPGERDELKLNLQPGRYPTVCTVANHRQLGMIGTLTVE